MGIAPGPLAVEVGLRCNERLEGGILVVCLGGDESSDDVSNLLLCPHADPSLTWAKASSGFPARPFCPLFLVAA